MGNPLPFVKGKLPFNRFTRQSMPIRLPFGIHNHNNIQVHNLYYHAFWRGAKKKIYSNVNVRYHHGNEDVFDQ